jgi:Phage integrase family
MNLPGEPAWVTAVLKAHDVAPVWKSYTWTALTPECHAEFRRINLRWHDLRHEYASRLVEKNVPLAQVRDLLGHASITTTERYDNQKIENLQAAAARLERGETFDPGPRESGSPSICQVFVKSEADQTRDEHTDRVRETPTNVYDDQDLEIWLGGRDSNPDNVVQRAVDGVSPALVRAFSRRFSRQHLRPLSSVCVRSRAACLIVSHPSAPPSGLSAIATAPSGRTFRRAA